MSISELVRDVNTLACHPIIMRLPRKQGRTVGKVKEMHKERIAHTYDLRIFKEKRVSC